MKQEMDLFSLIEAIPVELQHIVASYDHLIIFLLPYSKLLRYDWLTLMKIIFSASYSKEVYTNEAMMKIYLNRSRKSPAKYCRENTIVRLTDGRFMGCGFNYGQMGLGDAICRKEFTVIQGLPKNIIEFHVGKFDATFRSYGTLMRSSLNTNRIFKKIKLRAKGIAEIIYGYGNSKFIRYADGTIMGSGYADHVFGPATRYFKKIDYVQNVAEVHCGYDHTILRLMSGTLMTCGQNRFGQLGLGDEENRGKFTEIQAMDKFKANIVEIIAGFCMSMIRLLDGTIMCCGYNVSGELGFGDTTNRFSFCAIKLIPQNIDRIFCGHYHTVVLLTNGALMCCGSGVSGQLGLGDRDVRLSFTEIGGVPRNVVDVYCGHSNTIIRLEDGTLLATGKNENGQLGLGDYIDRTNFQEIKPLPKNIVEVVCHETGTIIRLTDGTLMGCGSNAAGELGLGVTTYVNTFTEIKLDGGGFVTEIA
ncbi:MAG: chromosome condensation regulator [Hyperionvirus sp.]|uniref:Chromosome condensation regulator n=1 Tax=Hyperionvirus sp. TaxID=2487770 RepID=A0A3G5A781_9VIRU|nr:MAG: chromosome condensation regulator [Hyperionvirus sp.]